MNWLTSRCAPLVAFTALALASCDKGTDLNVDLPDTSAVNTEYQDLPLDVATVRLAPVQSLKTDHFLVGRLADNVAGATTASAYFNTISGSITDSLPSRLVAPVLDSVVMVMGYDKVYGSATTPVKFDVYKLSAPLDERQVFDAATPTLLNASDLLGQNLSGRLDRTQIQIVTPAVAATTTTAAIPAVTAVVPNPSVRLLLQRTAVAATATQPAVAGIPLQFATDLFTQLALPGSTFGQTQLNAALKGLALLPSASHTSSIVSFGRTYSSRMVVYYHSTPVAPATPDRRSYSLYFGPVYSSGGLAPSTDPRYYTQISNDLPPVLAQLATRPGFVPSVVLGGTSYIQEGTGLGTRITFQSLDALMNKPGLTVNRAELRVPIKPFTNALFSNPNVLYAMEVDANNAVLQRTVNFTPHDRVVQANGFDQLGITTPAVGVLTDVTTTQPYYSIPVTSYLQAYLNGKLDGNPTSLVLVPNIRTSSTLSLNRAALDAAHISLRVYYSKR